METYACGFLGLNIDYFYSLTFRQYGNIAKGLEQRMTFERQDAWEQTRLIMYTNVKPHVKKGSLRSPQEIMKFEWEEVEKEYASPDEVKAVLDQLKTKK